MATSNHTSQPQDYSTEEWCDIPGFEGVYQVSNLGRVKSLHYKRERIMCPHLHRQGYLLIALWLNGKPRNTSVHRLVAETFLKQSDNHTEVNHIDGDKANNRADNLEWVTSSQNQRHALENGLYKTACGSRQWYSKLTEEQVIEIRNSSGLSQAQLGRIYGVDPGTICLILNRKTWKHI